VQAPSNALLEHLKVLDKTKNGLVGLLVTQVYENSPGQTIGLKKLDILLSVAYEGSSREYEFLKSNEFEESNFNQFDFSRNPPMELFPAIRNEVTKVLSKLETGKMVTLKYIREGKLLTASFKLEKAPNDFTNASKYVDEDLGLHVKDVTFEVRESLHLKENETGVIISEVEQGKACDIAKLHYYCIILKVDDLSITSVENFKEIITAKKAKGITEFYFTVIFLGKTSLIKVNLKVKHLKIGIAYEISFVFTNPISCFFYFFMWWWL
jgi:S1-C subfamily serine protease